MPEALKFTDAEKLAFRAAYATAGAVLRNTMANFITRMFSAALMRAAELRTWLENPQPPLTYPAEWLLDFHWHGDPPPMHVPAQHWDKNPHSHDFRLGSSECEEDCPACAWNKARALKQREDLQMPPKAYTPTDADMKFLAGIKVSWYGDKRA